MTTDFDDVIEQQGWSEETVLIHVLGFIRHMKLSDSFGEYLERCAEEENAEVAAASEVA